MPNLVAPLIAKFQQKIGTGDFTPTIEALFREYFPHRQQRAIFNPRATSVGFNNYPLTGFGLRVDRDSQCNAQFELIYPNSGDRLKLLGSVNFDDPEELLHGSLSLLRLLNREFTNDITSIDLSGNALGRRHRESSIFSKDFCALLHDAPRSLRVLDLGNNELHQADTPLSHFLSEIPDHVSDIRLNINGLGLLPPREFCLKGLSQQLTKLDLESNRLGERLMTACEYFPASLLELKLGRNNAHLLSTMQLIKLLSSLPDHLQKLDLSYNKLDFTLFSTEVLNAFFRSLPYTLLSLDLRGNEINDDAIRAMLPFIATSKLTEVLVIKSFLSKEVCNELNAAIKGNQVKPNPHAFFGSFENSQSRVCDAEDQPVYAP